MLSLLVTAALLLPARAQDEKKQEPDPARVQAAIESLDAAFQSGNRQRQAKALLDARDLFKTDALFTIVRGLGERGSAIKAVEAFRWMKHPGLLDVLHRVYRNGGMIVKDSELYAALLQAIGQHGDESSIEVLADAPLKNTDPRVVRARLLGLARIRTPRAAQAFFRTVRALDEADAKGFAKNLELGGAVLTGEDHGASPAAWLAWWDEHQEGFEVPKKPPKLSEASRKEWLAYWEKPKAKPPDVPPPKPPDVPPPDEPPPDEPPGDQR